MERHFNRYQQLVRATSGQSTVEYAVVLGAVLCVVAALAALVGMLQDGTFAQHAVMAASHNVQGSVGGVVDVLCF